MTLVDWITIGAQMRLTLTEMAAIVILSIFIGCLPSPKIGRTSSLLLQDACIVYQVNNNKMSECKFPFIFNGNIYTSCSTDGASGNKSWCSTKVNSEGIHQEGFWGYCNESCPLAVGVPLNIKGDCPNRLLAKDFELFGLNGIYLLSEFGLLNGRVYYSSKADSDYGIWWEAVSLSWVVGNFRLGGFARYNSSENCPDNLIGNWMLINSSASSKGSVREDNFTNMQITQTTVDQKIYWKEANGFNWTILCRFETYQSTLIYLKHSECMMKCSDDETCSHFDWNPWMGGYCALRGGPVTMSDAFHVDDVGFSCGIKN